MFTTIVTPVLIALLLGATYVGYRGYMQFRRAEGSLWSRMWEGAKESATMLWLGLNAVSVALISAVTWASDLLGFPGLKEAMSPWLTPKLVLAYVLVLALGGVLTRNRTL
jgi:uncharacterized protein (DUF2062 family)